MNRSDLINALALRNVEAFLHVIRNGETSQDDEAYRALYGWRFGNGRVFASFDTHPTDRTYERYDGEFLKNGKIDYTTAAGAYQITETTWNRLVKMFGFEDFSPPNQDQAAIALLAGRGALEDVKAGRLDAAIRKLPQEWTSLALDRRKKEAAQVFQRYGGSLAAQTQPQTQEVKTMVPVPLLLAGLDFLKSAFPAVANLVNSGASVPERNVQIAATLLDAASKATASENFQEAIEKIQQDPAARAAAEEAIHETIPGLIEAGGGGIKGAREAAAASEGDWRRGFLNPAFVIGLLMVLLVGFVVVVVVLGLGKQTWSDEIKAMVVTAIVSGALGSVSGYFLGSSYGSQKKDSVIATKGGTA